MISTVIDGGRTKRSLLKREIFTINTVITTEIAMRGISRPCQSRVAPPYHSIIIIIIIRSISFGLVFVIIFLRLVFLCFIPGKGALYIVLHAVINLNTLKLDRYLKQNVNPHADYDFQSCVIAYVNSDHNFSLVCNSLWYKLWL